MSKAIAIGYLANVSLGNVNASHTEGNVMVAKKVTLPDGSAVPYVSGQAIRRMLRDRLEDLGWQLSEPFANVSGQEVTPPVQPWKYIDEDLFGYMDTSQNRRRTSPVRVSSLIGLFRFQGDRDLGTRSFEKFGENLQAGGNMFETEIYSNLFKGSILIEFDRIGMWKSRYELIPASKKENPAQREKEEKTWEDKKLEELSAFDYIEVENLSLPFKGFIAKLKSAKKIERLNALLEALKFLWGGGRTARMLVDLSPRFIAIMFLKVKHPVFLEAFRVTYEDGYYLDTQSIANAIQKFHGKYDAVIFGVEYGFFANEEEIKENLGELGTVSSVTEAIDFAKKKLDEQ